jgi:uncharacterized protein with HEPN domain
MFDRELLLACVDDIDEALRRIDRRFQGINSPDGFIASDEGLDRLDAIAMMLVWLGECIKRMDKLGAAALLSRHPEVDWKGAKGMRDILAHDYGNADPDAVYWVCKDDLETIRRAMKVIRKEIESSSPT